jgi:hypothetical protein
MRGQLAVLVASGNLLVRQFQSLVPLHPVLKKFEQAQNGRPSILRFRLTISNPQSGHKGGTCLTVFAVAFGLGEDLAEGRESSRIMPSLPYFILMYCGSNQSPFPSGITIIALSGR